MLFYASQISVSPPTIVVKCNVAKDIQPSYKRYMMRVFRESLGFQEVPIKLVYCGKNPNDQENI